MTTRRSVEQLRQERETFEQARSHDRLWFTLRLSMGYVGIALMIAVATVGTYVVLHPRDYTAPVLATAAAALLVDMIGLAAMIFRLVLQQGSAAPLRPVTRAEP